MDLSGRIVAKAFTITVFATVAAYAFFSVDHAVSVLAGGLLAVTNFRLSARFLSRVVQPGVDANAGKMLGIGSFILRYGLLAVALFVIIRSIASPVFLIIGLSVVVAAVLFSYGELRRAV